MGHPTSYDFNVFINCPFDEQFRPLFNSIVFTVHDAGFVARSALEVYNAGQVRIEKITKLISECRLGIHDLSRTQLDESSKLPRFNMPLELGIFLGAQWLGSPKQKRKSCIVLERERYRYQAFCSDIAGQDISAHHDDPQVVVRLVRNWLRSVRPEVSIPGGSKIWERYQQFSEDLPIYCDSFDLDLSELTFVDYTTLVAAWLIENDR